MRIASRRPFRVGRSRAGLGLFATRPIPKGKFLLKYWGPLVTNKEADEINNKYLFEISKRWTIDGSGRRNIARYINHSCRPNAETDVVKGEVLITIRKTIQPGEEITYDYGKDYFDTFIKPHGCRCPKCTEAKAKPARAKKAAKKTTKKVAKRKKK
jgi:uncharacterized protein